MSILNKDNPLILKSWQIVYKRWINGEAKMDWYLAPESTFLYHLAKSFSCPFMLPEQQEDCVVHFSQSLIET